MYRPVIARPRSFLRPLNGGTGHGGKSHPLSHALTFVRDEDGEDATLISPSPDYPLAVMSSQEQQRKRRRKAQDIRRVVVVATAAHRCGVKQFVYVPLDDGGWFSSRWLIPSLEEAYASLSIGYTKPAADSNGSMLKAGAQEQDRPRTPAKKLKRARMGILSVLNDEMEQLEASGLVNTFRHGKVRRLLRHLMEAIDGPRR